MKTICAVCLNPCGIAWPEPEDQITIHHLACEMKVTQIDASTGKSSKDCGRGIFMFDNLIIAALIVILFWIAIITIFLVISRQQPDVQAQILSVEEQLDKVERGSKK